MSAPLVRRSPAHHARVVATAELTPRMRRVTVATQSMHGVEVKPGQDVELLLREDSGRRVKRRYTIRRARPDNGELDLDVLLHGSGPGSAWGAHASDGDEVEFQGPRGKLELRPAPWHLLVGDESALPAIAAICEALPAAERATALIEVQDEADELALDRGTVRWLHRHDAEPGGADLLGAAVTAALDEAPVPPPEARAYLLGETRAVVAVRALLEDRGVPHDAIFVKGYWNRGRPDRLAGRAPR